MIPEEAWDVICICGQPASVRLYVHYRYPRTEYEPMAVDPHYVHGGGPSFTTCGSPQCGAGAFLACRERIISDHLRMCTWLPLSVAAEQMAGLELEVALSPGAGIRVLEDEGEAA